VTPFTPSYLITQLKQGPVAFQDVITCIDHYYDFTPTAFSNGAQHNNKEQNNGSCKIFAFAKWHQLDQQSTLHAFGDFYTHDVLNHPNGTDHQNIRQFIQHGWQGISFDGDALVPKARSI